MECIRCGHETASTFFCPCGLRHPLCGLCEARADDRDCALMADWNGYVGRAALQDVLPGIIRGYSDKVLEETL